MSNRLVKNTKKNTEEGRERIAFYNAVGKVFVVCGIVSFVLMGFVALMPQDYEKYNSPLAFGIWTAISVFLIALGIRASLFGFYLGRKCTAQWRTENTTRQQSSTNHHEYSFILSPVR